MLTHPAQAQRNRAHAGQRLGHRLALLQPLPRQQFHVQGHVALFVQKDDVPEEPEALDAPVGRFTYNAGQ